MAASEEALAEAGEGEDVAVDVFGQGLRSPQGQRDGQIHLGIKGWYQTQGSIGSVDGGQVGIDGGEGAEEEMELMGRW